MSRRRVTSDPPTPPPECPSLTWTEAPSCPQTGRWPSLMAAGSVSWWSTWTEPLWCQRAPGTSSCRCPRSAIQTPSPQSPDQWRQDYRPHIANPAASELTDAHSPGPGQGTCCGFWLTLCIDVLGNKKKSSFMISMTTVSWGGELNPQNSWNKTPNIHLKHFNIWQKKLVSVWDLPEIISLIILINKFQWLISEKQIRTSPVPVKSWFTAFLSFMWL